MKYFLDTEFIEGFHKPFFGKRRHFIDLISIGIVADDGREYYALSSEYDYSKSNQWVKDNVILPLYKATVHGDQRNLHDVETFHKFYGKTNDLIARDIVSFINPIEGPAFDPLPISAEYKRKHNTKTFGDHMCGFYEMAQPEFYAYFADYDWVVFCSLFGTMMQLPEGFPKYCIDLKQMIDGKAKSIVRGSVDTAITFDVALASLKSDYLYPKQENEHSAIYDARWDRELYDFLTF